MKKLFCFLAVASTSLFTSCGDDDANTTPPPVVPTTITLSANVNTLDLGAGSFTFTVLNQAGVNVANDAVITVNSAPISGVTWTPTAAGTFTVKATYNNVSSNTINVTVTEPEVPQTENTFTVNNIEFTTSNSYLMYLGTDENNVNQWVAAALKGAFDPETPAENMAMILFTNSQPAGQDEIVFPTVANMNLGAQQPATLEAYVSFDFDNELNTEDQLQTLNLKISSINVPQQEGDAQNWRYTYKMKLNDGTLVRGNYNGDWAFINGSSSNGRRANASKTITKLSTAQIQRNIARALNK
jgi:methionine-rich copper-binding protein CopC